jgi:hypothetical protein
MKGYSPKSLFKVISQKEILVVMWTNLLNYDLNEHLFINEWTNYSTHSIELYTVLHLVCTQTNITHICNSPTQD